MQATTVWARDICVLISVFTTQNNGQKNNE
jgi:hypothetical protein